MPSRQWLNLQKKIKEMSPEQYKEWRLKENARQRLHYQKRVSGAKDDLSKLDAAAASLDRERGVEISQLTAGVYAFNQAIDPEETCFAPVEIAGTYAQHEHVKRYRERQKNGITGPFGHCYKEKKKPVT